MGGSKVLVVMSAFLMVAAVAVGTTFAPGVRLTAGATLLLSQKDGGVRLTVADGFGVGDDGYGSVNTQCADSCTSLVDLWGTAPQSDGSMLLVHVGDRMFPGAGIQIGSTPVNDPIEGALEREIGSWTPYQKSGAFSNLQRGPLQVGYLDSTHFQQIAAQGYTVNVFTQHGSGTIFGEFVMLKNVHDGLGAFAYTMNATEQLYYNTRQAAAWMIQTMY